MFSSSSGLGRLFNSASASLPYVHPKHPRSYDSVIEDTVTHDLLFPDANIFHDVHTHAPFRRAEPRGGPVATTRADDRGQLDIQEGRDLRILIAQKIHDIHRVLLDTHPPSAYNTARTSPPPSSESNGYMPDSRMVGGLGHSTRIPKARTAPHSRQSSLSQVNGILAPPLSVVTENGGLFGGSKPRSGTQRPTTGGSENAQSRLAREEKEEQDDLLNCMFGAAGFLSTASTKVHVKPCPTKSPVVSRPTSPEKSNTSPSKATNNRRSILFRSTTAENLPSLSSTSSGAIDRQHSRRTSSYVLITRVFTLNLKEEDFVIPESHDQEARDDKELGSHSSVPQAFSSRSSNKQIKTPTFAVALVIYLPCSPGQRNLTSPFPPLDRSSSPTPASPRKSSYDTSDSRLDGRTNWVMNRLRLLTRGLTALEVRTSVQLRLILVSQYQGFSTNLRRALQLDPLALQDKGEMRRAIKATIQRTFLSLQIKPVVTGQDRWAIWKGVARTVPKATEGLGGRDFLLRLLTAFLTCQSEWLDVLAPRKYRQQSSQHTVGRQHTSEALPHRTVLVCPDKMLARRIIFLLSAFLPNEVSLPLHVVNTKPDSISSSFTNSAPLHDTPHSRTQSANPGTGTLTPNFTGSDTTDFANPGLDVSEGKLAPFRPRRESDAVSIRSIAMPMSTSGTRKNSVATAGKLPDPHQAIPHFAPYSTASPSSPDAERPGSGGSLAALSLQRTLSKTASNDLSTSSNDSRGRGYFGSLKSGFWSLRRGSSTENSDVISSSAEGLGISTSRSGPRTPISQNKLQQMVDDAQGLGKAYGDAPSHASRSRTSSHAATLTSPTKPKAHPSPPTAIPDSLPTDPFPLTLSFSEEDGIIDVQYSSSHSSTSPPHLDPHQGQTSFQSFPMSSSHSSTQAPTHPPIHRTLRPHTRAPPAAGFLRAFHPDFALQAMRPYDSMKEDIKTTMLAEPSHAQRSNPAAGSEPAEIKTLLADTRNLSISLLTLNDPSSPGPSSTALANNTGSGGGRNSTSADVSEITLGPSGTRITENLLTHQPPDPVIANMLDKILGKTAVGGASSSSTAFTPPPSYDQARAPQQQQQEIDDNLLLPRGVNEEIKMTVLGALGGLVRDIVAEVEAEGEVEDRGNSGLANLHDAEGAGGGENATPPAGNMPTTTTSTGVVPPPPPQQHASNTVQTPAPSILRQSIKVWLQQRQTHATVQEEQHQASLEP